jgi:hypothetical protein
MDVAAFGAADRRQHGAARSFSCVIASAIALTFRIYRIEK